jgi:hypothetical protein
MSDRGRSTTLPKPPKYSLIPVAPISAVLRRLEAAQNIHTLPTPAIQIHGGLYEEILLPFGAMQRLAHDSGVKPDTLHRVKQGRRAWVDFDLADKIITGIDPTLWHTDLALSAIYQSFDLAKLDERRPTTEVAA